MLGVGWCHGVCVCACQDGLGHLFREELSKFKWAFPQSKMGLPEEVEREREGSPSTSLSFSVYLSLSISSHFLSISLQRPIPPTKYSPVTFLHQNQVIVSSKEGRVISEFGWMLRRNQVSQPTRCNISSQLDRTIRVAALLKREGLIYQIG